MTESNKEKIIIMTADSSIGGGSSHILGLLENIDKDKFLVNLACPKGYLPSQASKIYGVNTYNIPFKGKFDLYSYVLLLTFISKIKVKEYPFSKIILHSHGTRAGWYSFFIRDSLVKKIYTEHLYTKEYHLKSRFSDRIQKWLMRKVYDSSDKIVCVSKAVKRYIASLGIPEKKLIVIPNAVESKIVATKKIKENNTTPIIGTVGSLNFLKGQKYLVLAMKKVVETFPLARLEIVGGGEECEALQRLISSNHLKQNISLLGSKKDVNEAMRYWNVFALPSLSESFGIVILEAMKNGIPVVATKVGGIPEVIKNNSNGLLIESRDSNKLGEAIINVIKNPVLAAKLKRNGYETLKEYDWKNIIEKIESVYEGI